MAIQVINVQKDTWTEIGPGIFSFQVLGDRPVWYTEAESTPVGQPPHEVESRKALPEEKINFRASSALSRLFVYTTSMNGTNIAVDKPTFIDTFVQDQTTAPVEHWLTNQMEAVTIQANIAKDDNTIVLNAGAGSTIVDIEGNGYYLEIRYDNPDHPGVPIIRFYQGEIVTYTDNVVNVTIEVDTPLDFSVDTTYIESVYIVDANASRSSETATTSNRIEMCTFPPDSLSWDLTRLMVTAVLDSVPDDGKFMDQTTPLTWGIYFGVDTPLSDKYLANVKVNAGFAASAYDITYTSRSSPQNPYGLRVRKTFGGPGKYGVVVRLTTNQDKFCVWLQEPWNTDGGDYPIDCRFKVMGHEVD